MIKKEKVLMCLSGGVDSSVSASLLVEQGYDVTAAFMVNYDEKDTDCWKLDYQDAVRVAAKLKISLIKLDFTTEYSRDVLKYMFNAYEKGLTPNPDVLCNKYIKFGAWLNKAEEMGFNKIATGHYAQVKNVEGKYILQEGKDKNKDQTYFLHQLNQKQLSKIIFPIGKYTKDEVRKIAKKQSLPTAEKKESMGICFIGKVDMKEFLMKKIKTKKGDIVLSTTKEIIGEHDGLPFYTIGQRHLGVKIPNGKNMAIYVLAKNKKKNQLIVGDKNDPLLYTQEISVNDVHWINEIQLPMSCLVRLRHRQTMQKCKIKQLKNKKSILVKFGNKQQSVTPGQFAVFYKNNICLGGGVIQ